MLGLVDLKSAFRFMLPTTTTLTMFRTNPRGSVRPNWNQAQRGTLRLQKTGRLPVTAIAPVLCATPTRGSANSLMALWNQAQREVLPQKMVRRAWVTCATRKRGSADSWMAPWNLSHKLRCAASAASRNTRSTTAERRQPDASVMQGSESREMRKNRALWTPRIVWGEVAGSQRSERQRKCRRPRVEIWPPMGHFRDPERSR